MITTSGAYSNSYPASNAFDNNASSMWISSVWQTPAWIGYEFNQGEKITQYSIDYTNGSITTRAPKDFQLQGSNGTQWYTLDERNNEVNWSGSEKRSFVIQNPGTYKKYRLVVSDDNDTRSGVVVISIGTLTLERCGCGRYPDQTQVQTGPSLNISASGEYSSSYPAWRAFDDNPSSMWISQVWQTPAWIDYRFPEAKMIEDYRIQYTNGSITTRAPKEFSLQGSNGSSWVTLDTRSNETNWSGNEARCYAVADPGYYNQYRLQATDDNDSRGGVVVISIGDLSLEGH
ncbi:discoidin domain-containing protein [Shewanella surugensis]|uniref:Discoidin domain-containing protein n=1 Tax=Shewanella surugensis TaxID=212020 RepID=A0ABT0L8Q6_9GAMM|nr:discoidin domain-containing protein [Shewanella surugensis]MCL1123732.1 discoidin domain-containing protein [Shewanella surugensis]